MSDSTEPPATHQSQPSTSTEDWLIDKVKAVRRESSEALDTARDALTIAKKIQADIGEPSKPALGIDGTGFWGAVDRLYRKVDLQSNKIDALATQISARTDAEADRRKALLWAVKIIVGVILTVATTGGITWFVTLHH